MADLFLERITAIFHRSEKVSSRVIYFHIAYFSQLTSDAPKFRRTAPNSADFRLIGENAVVGRAPNPRRFS